MRYRRKPLKYARRQNQVSQNHLNFLVHLARVGMWRRVDEEIIDHASVDIIT